MKKRMLGICMLTAVLAFAGCSSQGTDKKGSESEVTAAPTETAVPTETVTPSPTATPAELPQAVKDSSYIVEGSDTRSLTPTEINSMDANTKQMAINEIYARHGRLFDTPEIQAYFNSKSWYKGTIPASQFDESVFNDYERMNIKLLTGEVSAENQSGSTNYYFPGEYRCTIDQFTEISLQISLGSDPGIDDFLEGDVVGGGRALKTEYFPDGVNSETDMTEFTIVKSSGINNYVLTADGVSYTLTVDADGNGLTLSNGQGSFNGYYTLIERYRS